MTGLSRRRGSGDPEARGKRAVEAHGEAPVANHACNSHSSIVTAADEKRHREGCGPAFHGLCFEGSWKAVKAQGDAAFANHGCVDRFCQRSGALVRVETCCQTGIVKRQTVHGQFLAARPVDLLHGRTSHKAAELPGTVQTPKGDGKECGYWDAERESSDCVSLPHHAGCRLVTRRSGPG